jgi:hypothetical protein
MMTSGGAIVRAFCVALLPLVFLSAGATPETFTGVITDSECDAGDHSYMRMGATDAECIEACVGAHGASYVLYDGTRAYGLTDQNAPKSFAGRRVRVTGTLDSTGRTIQVDSVSPLN